MKYILYFLFLFVSLTTSAQEHHLFIGGKTSIIDRHIGNTIKIIPEIGYQFDKSWSAGINLGFETGSNGKFKSVSPFVRWTFLNKDKWHIFVDVTESYYWSNLDGGTATNYEIGLEPGVLYTIAPHFHIMLQYAFLGYRDRDFKHSHKHAYADFSTDMIKLGLQITFKTIIHHEIKQTTLRRSSLSTTKCLCSRRKSPRGYLTSS